MPYDPQKHHRRSIRLTEYDYTQPGAYYITICTAARQCLFGTVVKGEMRLNLLGYIAKLCWSQIPAHFPHIQLDTYVIMPDHLHGILVIIDDTNVRTRQCRVPTKEQFGKPVRGSILPQSVHLKALSPNRFTAFVKRQQFRFGKGVFTNQ